MFQGFSNKLWFNVFFSNYNFRNITSGFNRIRICFFFDSLPSSSMLLFLIMNIALNDKFHIL